ncbi:sodium/hydrogen exchanger [Thermincola ferriacetica]|uniref:Sodium/hydrogen exchanger n=1 Tax=Thermincola ferriacetica TaxID=281456 RepID=A0A0L6VYU7_9FIRM|nr:cation:proton antiporter [Thermincola ferriacetica]KNZ68396.1 sodium/hydrogen exchanger [Thermincola ferriacetica]
MTWYHELQRAVSESILLQLVIVLTATKLFGTISKRLNQPTVFGKLLAGLIIGPSLLGILQPTEIIKELAEVGVIVLMFLAGLETDVEEFRKAGFASTLTAVGGVILPLLAGLGIGLATGHNLFISLFIGTLLTATSVSISATTLRELGRLQTPVGLTILGAAVIDDILGIVVLTLVLGLAGAGSGIGAVGILIGKMVIFFVVALVIGKKLIPPILKFADKMPVNHGLTTAGLVLAFVFAYVAELSGVANITGAYIAGVLIGMTKFGHQVTEHTETVGFTTVIPVFFVSIGLLAQVNSLQGGILFVTAITLIAILTKILGCGVGARIAGFNNRDSLVIGAGMISRGEIALIIATIGLNRNLINDSLFTASVVMVLITTIITPPLLKAIIVGRGKNENTSLVNPKEG